ncbi:uncharacterized protein FA14DRAFT_162350 [Meira miltonrushii]|uniref:Dynactin subunit 2 n=1 Tax=Meira miltonrushii TaxID=1280837 RepID=A0A316V3F7_9BASI|nr:uncharacterized protein FA14DRAFT_162350 [Meira miltonrushii]PWN32089.1 hypothetical protein FA14DRAFT_162350 [Meira miltonrushii]
MSASKFAGLEGVDLDSPDVYETHSPSPKSKSRGLTNERRYGSSDSDSASDEGEYGDHEGNRRNRKIGQSDKAGNEIQQNKGDIIKTHLNAEEAAKRFRDATGVESKGVDFSSSIQRRKKKADYYPRTAATFETTTYSLGSGSGYKAQQETERGETPWRQVGEKESSLDRFRRLRFELEELEKEVQGEKPEQSQSKGEGDKDSHEDLLPQLKALRQQLAGLNESGAIGQSDQQSDAIKIQAEARRLLQQLSIASKAKDDAGQRGSDGTREQTKDDEAPTSEMVKLSDLDHRLAGLESLIGIQDALQSEAQALPRPLLPSLARIEHLLTLLTQPRHLDGISRRIKVLVSELERVHEARRKLMISGEEGDVTRGEGTENGKGDGPSSINLAPETLKKLDTVLPILSRVDSMLPIVPTLLSRLQSLSSLHASSANFAHDVEALQGILKSSNMQSQEIKQMLGNLQSSLVENEQRTKDNLVIVEERIESITKRMEAFR